MTKEARWEKEWRKPLFPREHAGHRADGIDVEYIDAACTPWAETDRDIAEGLAWGEEKDRLLDWIRQIMNQRLSQVERQSIELYYFQGLTYRQAGRRLGLNPSSVLRAVRRGLWKLQRAAADEDIALDWPPQAESGGSTSDSAK